MEEEDDTEKTEQPSQYRIDEFRERGEVASSKEFTTVILLLASILTLFFCSTYMYEVLMEYFRWTSSLNPQNAFQPAKINELMIKSITVLFKCSFPVFISTTCFGILGYIVQIGFIFSPEVLTFKPDRINPVKGFQRLFSKKAIFDTGKGLFKFALIIYISYVLLEDKIEVFNAFFHITLIKAFVLSKTMMIQLALAIIGGLAIIGLADFAWEKYLYRKKLFLTKQQAKEEIKEKEGSPEVKQRIRSIQRELSHRRMVLEIPKADVVISNPTHYSVVIKYDAEKMTSPRVVVKGIDYLALKIREIAKEHDIPIVENVPLARTLYKTVKVGESIPQTLYKAVAEILAFVYKVKKRKQAVENKI